MKLHEAILTVLKESEMCLNIETICNEINNQRLYLRHDKKKLGTSQVRARIRKKEYRHLFHFEEGIVCLPELTVKGNVSASKVGFEVLKDCLSIQKDNLLEELVNDETYFDIKSILNKIPDSPGLYSLYLSESSALPDDFEAELNQRKHGIIYIGIASKSLKNRLKAELEAKGHGTFFRSIGAMLGYRPPVGSVLNKKNKRNYKFSKDDNERIVKWIKKNLRLTWYETSGDIDLAGVEKELINLFSPLINLDHNPRKMQNIVSLRSECRRIANTEIPGVEIISTHYT